MTDRLFIKLKTNRKMLQSIEFEKLKELIENK